MESSQIYSTKWVEKETEKGSTKNLIQEKLLKLYVYAFSEGKGKKRRRQGQFMLNSTEIEHFAWTKLQSPRRSRGNMLGFLILGTTTK